MTIASELTALQGDITSARAAVTAKGGSVTSGGGSSQLATDIATIPTGVDTSQDTVTAGSMLSGTTAHNSSGNQITGTIPIKTSGNVTTSSNVVTIPSGYYDSQVQKTVGTAKSAQTYTPGRSSQTIAAGNYLTGAQTILGDFNLFPTNIKKDVSIFGVTGTYEGTSKPKEVSKEQEMESYKQSSIPAIGDALKYTGTTGTYNNGDIYVVEPVYMGSDIKIKKLGDLKLGFIFSAINSLCFKLEQGAEYTAVNNFTFTNFESESFEVAIGITLSGRGVNLRIEYETVGDEVISTITIISVGEYDGYIFGTNSEIYLIINCDPNYSDPENEMFDLGRMQATIYVYDGSGTELYLSGYLVGEINAIE